MRRIFLTATAVLVVFLMIFTVSCNNKEEINTARSEYTVKFSSNGGTAYDALTVKEGQRVELPTPEKDGYIFNGWYKHTDFSGDALSGVWKPDSTYTLYAKWTPIVTYTVSFETNGGNEIDPIVTCDVFILPDAYKSGNYFGGWFDNQACEGEPITEGFAPNADLTLYALWIEKNPNPIVSFECFGGTKYVPIETGRAPVVLPTPEKEYFDFAGWYLDSEFTGEPISGEYSFDDDATVYAKWERKAGFVEISFESEGQTEHKPVYIEAGKSTLLPIPSNYGYKFLGWYNGDTKADNEFATSKDILLKAKWEKVTYVYVYYGLTSDMERYECKSGSAFKLSDIDEKCKADAVFEGIKCPLIGWTYENGTVVPESITIGDEHVIIVAKYDETRLPFESYFVEMEGGALMSNGKGIYRHHIADTPTGTFSIDMIFTKGASGGAGVSFRQSLSGSDYPFEQAGNEYIAAVIGTSNGVLDMSYVKNGKWTRITIAELNTLPASWQNKYNSAAASSSIEVTLTVKSYADKFEIYLDGELAYTCNNSSLISGYKGTGFGIRSTTNGTVFKNPMFDESTDAALPLNSPVNVSEN